MDLPSAVEVLNYPFFLEHQEIPFIPQTPNTDETEDRSCAGAGSAEG